MLVASKGLLSLSACAVLACLPLTSRAASTNSTQAPAAIARVPDVPGQVNRYTIPFFTSQNTLSGSQSYTGVAVLNNSTTTCDVSVKFQFGQESSNACVIKASISPRIALTFCSRAGHDPVFPCDTTCAGDGLTFTTGHIYIASTNSPACSNIDVDGHLFYTTNNDTVVQGT